MSFLRLSMVFCAYAAATFALSQASAAQGFKEISLAVEPDSARGYMALGGGLEKALIDEQPPETTEIAGAEAKKPAVKKETDEPEVKRDAKSATASHRREPPRVARSAPRRAAVNVTPIALVARTLDHTGMNIGLLRVQTPAP